MPKKRQSIKLYKPSPTASLSSAPPSSGKSPKSVNELLASLRRTPACASPSASASHAITPTLPPALRGILQIPETPPPAPRRPLRTRVDGNGRRLPAGPPPPRSWLAARENERSAARSHGEPQSLLKATSLPGTYLPSPGSLIDIVLGRLAADWDFHRVYNQHHIYHIPTHLKPALIRWLAMAHDGGPSSADLKLILFPSPDLHDETSGNAEISHLDLSGSVGRGITLKEVSELLLPAPARAAESPEEPQDSWDADPVPPPPRSLLPNLTHLSLALDPRHPDASWKQLLALSSKLSCCTHLSLAHWPVPCLTPRARCATVATPQGTSIAYAGTSLYSHSLDQDWSEALLVLRMLSRNLYALEFLDLTGCASWFRALMVQSEHDFVDWAGSWGKISLLRLYTGWGGIEGMSASRREAHREAMETAAGVERHIRGMRAGQGRFITVERDHEPTERRWSAGGSH